MARFVFDAVLRQRSAADRGLYTNIQDALHMRGSSLCDTSLSTMNKCPYPHPPHRP